MQMEEDGHESLIDRVLYWLMVLLLIGIHLGGFYVLWNAKDRTLTYEDWRYPEGMEALKTGREKNREW